MLHRRRLVLFLALFLLPISASAHVLRVEIQTRQAVLGGRSFGTYGPYELIRGRIVFGFDPANPMNAGIVDLARAPRRADGLVEAWADLVVLQPSDPDRRRGVALVEVSNRGGMAALRLFNRATETLDPDAPEAFGDALLLRTGLTVIWVGWQFDVPARPGLLRLHVPRARHLDASSISGLVRADWTVDQPASTLPLGHRDHVAYPVADFNDPANVLTVRDGRNAPRRVVPRDRWRFARETDEGRIVPDSTHVVLTGGFEAGKIYEMVYRATDPALVGLGLAAVRDVIAYAKHDAGSPFPVRVGLAVGISQTGRFLRHLLYQGFNTDEQGRQAYDGLLVLTAGAGRGSFNHRFAQPSRDAHRYSAFFYPTDLFPFTDRPQLDSLQWRSDGLLSHLSDPGHAPRTFYVNTGYEYWGRAASLLHTTVDGTADVDPPPTVRIYHVAGAQHYPMGVPLPEQSRTGTARVYRGNPLDTGATYRALLVRLVDWLVDDVTPPPSVYPRRRDGTLVPITELALPRVPGVASPRTIHVAYRADYGPRWSDGIIDVQPPRLGPPFPSLVAQVDAAGNEAAGIRGVDLRVPVATYLPWHLRTGLAGGNGELTDFLGTFSPFPRTEAEKTRTGDPRPSLAALYADRAAYLARVRIAADALVDEGFLLPEDVDHTLRRAGQLWDWVTAE